MLFLLTFIQKASEFAMSPEGRQYNPPEGPLYYIVLIASSLLVAAVFIIAIKLFIWPGEKSEDHIKRKMLDRE
ncbi:MAG: hypothetical protein U5J95_11430 [Balneolaceae bacterium]|nr:hypothetical protein [Balneolaceae bacterium]